MAGLEVLVETIGKASSQDPAVVKLAEETIKEWETDSNFYKALLVGTVQLKIDNNKNA